MFGQQRLSSIFLIENHVLREYNWKFDSFKHKNTEKIPTGTSGGLTENILFAGKLSPMATQFERVWSQAKM